MLDQVGPAISAAHSMFVYGPPGNGKTVIAQAIRNLLEGEIAVPYAIEVEGSIVRLFDPVNHQPIAPAASPTGLTRSDEHDARWVRCRRPMVMVGGELTLEALELAYSPSTGFYSAPVQAVANGGVLVIDDFGRQRCSARDLLNRWIVPLESRVDFLTLKTGQKFELPFMVLVVFATNIRPSELVDEAFLRRIHYKVLAESPTIADFKRIFSNVCREREICVRRADRRWAARHAVRAETHRTTRLPPARSDRSGSGAGRLPRPAARADTRPAGGRLRQLFRRRYRDRVGHRLIAGWATAAAALVATTAAVPAAALADHAAPELRITSPLGRTGLPGTIRIVARLENLDPHKPVAVQFFVDGQLLASDTDGPPFDAHWTDENPFERRELTARAEVAGDTPLTDTVVLEPLELTDVAEITSVLVEATVVDKDGRFIQGLTKSNFEVLEDGRAAGTRRHVPAARPRIIRAARGQQPEHGHANRRRPRNGGAAARSAGP